MTLSRLALCVLCALATACGHPPGYDPAVPDTVYCGCGDGDDCYNGATQLDAARGEHAETGEQLLYYAQCACYGGTVAGCNTVFHFAKDYIQACDAGLAVRDSCAIAGFVYRHGIRVPSFNGRSYAPNPASAAAAFAKACSAGAQIACPYAAK